MSEVIKVSRQIDGSRFAKRRPAHALTPLENERTQPSPQADAPRTHSPSLSAATAVDVEEALDAAYRKGFEEGGASAEIDLRAELDRQLSEDHARVSVLNAGIMEQLHRLQERVARDAFRFALAVAGKIVKREVTLDNDVVIRQIQEALHRVAGVESVKIRVNPHDEPIIRDRRTEILAASDSVRDLIIEGDDKIELGGCILETASGNVDARLSTQLDQIEAALFGNLIH